MVGGSRTDDVCWLAALGEATGGGGCVRALQSWNKLSAEQLPTCRVLQRGGAVALAGLNHLQQAGAAQQSWRIEVQ